MLLAQQIILYTKPMPAPKPVKPKKQKPLTEMEKTVLAYAQTAKELGCPREQVENFFKAQIFLQPKQLEMASACRSADHRCSDCEAIIASGQDMPIDCAKCGPTAVGFGGPRGFGKSQFMFAQICADDCQRYPGLKVLLLRKSVKALREQINDLLKKVCAFVKYDYQKQSGMVHFQNGSFIVIGHFKDESEINNYLGQEYDVIAIEELTTLTFDKWKNLLSCLRSSKPGWRPRFYGAWNWGGIGHSWVKQVFYDPWKNGVQRSTRYIFGTINDNKFVNPEYKNELKSYTGWKYQSWYLGDPNFVAGQFFTNFSPDIHVFPNESVKFDVSKVMRWFGSMDYGMAHPNTFGLHCEDTDGNYFTTRTYGQSDTLIQDHCENIRDILRLQHLNVEDLEFISAGRDCFRIDKDGSTVASEYAKHGFHLTPVQIDRINAWSQCHERLGDVSRGVRPTWYIHCTCTELIDQIQVAQADEKKPGDIVKMNADRETGEGGDDFLEMWRNACVSEYNSVLRDAKPIRMGNYETVSDRAIENDAEERGEILIEQEVD